MGVPAPSLHRESTDSLICTPVLFCYTCTSLGTEQCTTGDVHLMDTNAVSTVTGRVEVCFEGIWGTVCAETTWDGRDASVVCRKLGVNASCKLVH